MFARNEIQILEITTPIQMYQFKFNNSQHFCIIMKKNHGYMFLSIAILLQYAMIKSQYILKRWINGYAIMWTTKNIESIL